MTDDPLDFGIDIADVRARVELLGYFLSVTDILEASEALDETLPAIPPAAFVGTAREQAEPGQLIQDQAQRVPVEVVVLFVESASRMDGAIRDQMETTRRAIIRQLFAWKPRGALKALRYGGYRVVSIGGGLAWGEVTFTTSYRLHT